MDIRADWIRRANALHKADPTLSRQDVVKQLKDAGHPRPTGVENNGFRGPKLARYPVWGTKTRSPGQTQRRNQHEQPSTPESADNLERLRQWQEEINNIAAHAGLEGAHHEHRFPSDATDALGGEGAPGDYVNNRPNPYSKWKTAVEQYNRTKRDNRYRLIETPEGVRIVDSRYADARVDPYDLPGMDIDESMDVGQVFSALPFIVAHDLSMRQTQFPGQTNPPGLTTTADGQVHFRMPALPGFDTSVQPGPSVTAAPGTYSSPQVMETNGSNETNGHNGHNGSNGHNGGSPPPDNGPPDNGFSEPTFELPSIDYDNAKRVVVGAGALAGALVVEGGKIAWQAIQGGY